MSYNPITSISGNGVLGQVTATITTGSSFWNIVTHNMPGQAITGTFPNSQNSFSILSQNFNYTWPFRGGKNLPNPATRTITPVGEVGISAIGVVLYNSRLPITVSGQNGTIWNLNSVVAKVFGEDIYGGRPTGTGIYNYHDNGFIKNNAWGSITTSTFSGGSYTQSTDGHSKIVGWARDGYPIYGPYGYQTPLDIFSPVVRMQSGYQINLRANRPTSRNVVVNGAVTSATSFLVYSTSGITIGLDLSGSSLVSPAKVIGILGTRITVKTPVTLAGGSILTASYVPGTFVEDWTHYTSNNTLDIFNGRYCVTPEYPNGTYAYFLTEDASSNPTYPYIVGPSFYGSTIIDSTNTQLTNIIPALGVLTPAFSSTVTNYSVTVDNSNTSTQFTAFVSSALSSLKFNNNPLGSGVLSPSIPISVGLTTSTFAVTSQYQNTSTYTVTVNRLRKSVKDLSNLVLSVGTLSPTFDANVTSYSVTYNTDQTSIDVTATRVDADSNIIIEGNAATSGLAVTVNLLYGVNIIEVVVVAQDGTTKTYTINATRLSNIAALNGITTNQGSISPTFNQNIYAYSLTVTNATTSISISADPIDNLSEIYVDGVFTSANTLSNPIDLTVGLNPISITIVSSDGSSTQNYRINVDRTKSSISTLSAITLSSGSLSPSFNAGTTSYTVNLSNATTGINVTVQPTEINSSIKINDVTVNAGVGSQLIPLNVGSNQIEIVVTSHNGIVQTTYTVIATRAASTTSSLNNLLVYNAVLSPSFSSGVYNYSDTVTYNIQNTIVRPTSTDVNSTIRVNNISVLSNQESQSIPLVIGVNTVTTVVTAQDGISTSTYRVVLTRRNNFDASLAFFSINVGELTPEFDKDITDYSVNLLHNTIELEINAVATDINVTGIAIDNGVDFVTTATANLVTSIPLYGSVIDNAWDGLTVVEIIVVAADGESYKSYTINANRSPSAISTLTNLTINLPGLQPTFDPNVTEYYLGVPHASNSVGVTATASDPLQQLIINGTVTPSGIASSNIPLYVGNNTIPVVSLAADQNYSTGYSIFINRASLGLDTNSLLSNLELSTGTFSTNFSSNVTSYQVDIPYSVSEITVKPTKQRSSASIKVDDINVISGQFSSPISLAVGNTTITVVVTAEDNSTKTEYIITVTRIGNIVSSLSNLYVSAGQLDKPFNPTETQYSVNVKHSTNQISVRPFTADNQAVVSVNTLACTPNEWSAPVNLNVGENVVTIRTVAGDLFNETIYQVKFIRAVAGVVNPTDLFLVDATNISANFIAPNILRIFTKVNTSNVTRGTFPNLSNTWTAALQNLEIVFPYRGGENQQAVTKLIRSNDSTIGVTVVGIPIKSPTIGETVAGPNDTTWTINSVFTGVYGNDAFGGVTGPNGYYYTDNRFVYNGGWNNTPEWYGFMSHPDGHSKLLGYSADGYPIYGPYGYSKPLTSYSTVTEMISAYSIRIGANRPVGKPVTYNGNELGAEIQLVSAVGVSKGMQLTGGPISTSTAVIILGVNTITNYIRLNQTISFGPFAANLQVSYLEGSFTEDYYYNPAKSGATLDVHNGRYCVTPEYPFGTYAYFSTGATKPEYPYFIGNTFYAPLTTIDASIKSPPTWVTPVGFIVTATEGVSISRTVTATGGGILYKLISGQLPPGMEINTSTGAISGTPAIVYQTITSEFIVRATNQWGVIDRKFSIDVRGATPPVITTPGPRPAVGPSGEQYLVNGQIVDFQFSATSDILPSGKSLFYFIEDGDGQLPPGLTLTSTGRLYGQVQDDLSLFYRAASDGRYDADLYDLNPYEHVSIQEFGIKNKFVNRVYRFSLSVSNGIATKKAEYTIDVNDPATYVEIGPYPVPVQWITLRNLGSVRANTNIVISLETHDCDEGGGTISYDWFSANNGDLSVVPEGLSLDSSSGVISGFIRYTPIYSTTYNFKLRVYKTSVLTGSTSYREKSFSLTVLGSVISSMVFETGTVVGLLYQGEQSELAISAIHSNSSLNINYSLQSGSLPPGLALSVDGAIQGVVNYNTATTVTTTYNFSVKAKDSSLTNEIIGNFSISVYPYQGKKYTSIFMQPLLRLDSRLMYEQFINDQSIFDPALLYRKYDPAFGIQTSVKYVIEHAIEELKIASYVPALQQYFSRKKLQFGSIKSAFATDSEGNITYEVVYVELFDNLVNQDGVPIGASVEFENTISYPNSINNMRVALESVGQTDEYLWPKFMRTVQGDTGMPLGRILCMPICFCLPGNSATIINRINNSGFNFKMINFDVDRITVLNISDNNTTKYLLFPNKEV
jgi:hypothetical protein